MTTLIKLTDTGLLSSELSVEGLRVLNNEEVQANSLIKSKTRNIDIVTGTVIVAALTYIIDKHLSNVLDSIAKILVEKEKIKHKKDRYGLVATEPIQYVAVFFDKNGQNILNSIPLNISENFLNIEENKIGFIEIKKEPKITTNMPKKVFISYNHGDKDAARHLKNALVAAGLEVTIDSEAMMAGSKISDFIRKSIQETDVTVSIVSEKSLLSAWVAMESILTLHTQKQFIACYITDKFFDLAFVRSSAETVALRIDNIQKEIQERFTINMGIEDLSDELSRQQDLRHNLPKIIGDLRSRLCIDIAGYNFLDNVPKVIRAIKGE